MNVTHLTTQSNQAISAANGSYTFQTLSFANSNGVSFSTGTQGIYASVAAAGGAQTGISGLSAGTTQMTSGTAVFSNANGISFGVNGNTVTASYTVPTQSVQPVAVSGSNGSFTFSTATFGNLNGVSFYTSNGSLVASYTVPSTAGLLSAINISGGTTSNNLSAITFSNSNGVTFGLNGSVMTASHNGLTTARASNDAIGLNTAQSNVTWTVNSSGLSLDARGYAGTGFSGTNISGTVDSVGIRLSVAPGGGGADGYNIVAAGTQTANTTGTIMFSNSNGITFGMSNSSIVTASHNGLTQQSTQPVALSGSNGSFNFSTATFGSSNGMHFYTTNGSMVGSYTVPTVTNSSFSVQDSATTINPVARIAFSTGNNITLSLSTGASSATVGVAHNLAGTSTGFGGNLISASMTHNSSGLNVSLNHPAWLTTAMQSNAVTISNINVSAGTTSTNASAFTFSNANGITFGLDTGANAGKITASHNGLTTARASTDAIGLNTAQSNVTWTVNSSGLSFDARGYAGTATTFNGTNVSGSMTLNSAGLRLDLSAPTPGGGAAINVSAGTTSGNLQTIVFSNSNGVSFGLNGSTVTASVNAGAGGGVNIAASNTTFTSGTVQFNGSGALTVNSGAQAVNLSVPATSSLVGTNGISLSSNGSTISISGVSPYASRFIYPEANLLTGLSAFGNGSMSVQYVPFDGYVTATRLDALFSWSAGSSGAANTAAVAMSVFAGIYTRNGLTLNSVSSGTTQTTYTYASNTSNYTAINSAIRPVSVPININMTPGEYYVAFGMSTNSSSVGTATTNLAQTISAMGYGGLQSDLNYAEFGSATATSNNLYSGMGIYSAALSTVPPTISLSAINQTGTNISRANIALVFRNY